MKSFYRHGRSTAANGTYPVPAPCRSAPARAASSGVSGACRARIAVYDSPAVSPRVEEVLSEDPREFIDSLSQRAYALASERGGSVPYTVIREVAENLLHAAFADVVVSVLDGGRTVRFADRGPGISDKERAFLPGFTTADEQMRRYIRGVGSGLPIVRESVGFTGGFVHVDDNLGRGTVVTVSIPTEAPGPGPVDAGAQLPGVSGVGCPPPEAPYFAPDEPALSVRQKQVLSLVMELGSVGPTLVSRELRVGLSTAYRDLSFLEEIGLLSSDPTGKRCLTDRGVDYLDALMS